MRLSLSRRIFLAIVGVLALAVLSSVVAIISAYKFEELQDRIVNDNLPSVRAAEELEIALLDQRGYVTKYMLDGGNQAWLSQLKHREGEFEELLQKARETIRIPQEREILDQLEVIHALYSRERERVIQLYNEGRHDEARDLLFQRVEELHRDAYALCELFIVTNAQIVESVNARARRQVNEVTIIVSATAAVTLLLGSLLLWLFLHGVVLPLRRLSRDAREATGVTEGAVAELERDELGELGRYVQLLMTDVAETRSDLQRSRDQLANAEKLAAVGRLAAGLAHEIRNPLTAMKMWLFSLRRTLAYDQKLVDKVNVVSREIVRLESIVRQFLEFSRPPELKKSPVRIDDLLRETLGLQSYLLQQHRIRVNVQCDPQLPAILADAEQLKQVIINLVNNAIEAMQDGGELRIRVARRWRADRGHVFIRFADTGPGMPREVQQRVFEPFLTTKAGGTGLGLCIAATIVARHGGNLALESSTSQGTEWGLWLPEADASATPVALPSPASEAKAVTA
jgi:signal transduction histidine kinase